MWGSREGEVGGEDGAREVDNGRREWEKERGESRSGCWKLCKLCKLYI